MRQQNKHVKSVTSEPFQLFVKKHPQFRLALFTLLVLAIWSCKSTSISSAKDDPFAKGKVYIVYTSDHDAPIAKPGIRQFEYETIYAMSKRYGPDFKPEKSIRLSSIGGNREPVWNKAGDKVAYLSYSTDIEARTERRLIIYDVHTREDKIFAAPYACTCGLSWDETGEHLMYGADNRHILRLTIASGKIDTILSLKYIPTDSGYPYKHQIEDISLSPDGRHVAFMTRDGTDVNDDDGWRPNIFTIGDENVIKVGLLNDRFGMYGEFRWHKNSSRIVFVGFFLDEQEDRYGHRYWTYDLDTQQLNPIKWNTRQYYQQHTRYWRASMIR